MALALGLVLVAATGLARAGITERVSLASNGAQGNGLSYKPSISADGRFVAFRSQAGNLVAGDTNGSIDAFVHDRQTGQTTRVSVASDGTQGDAGSGLYGPSISADGRFVAFDSYAGNLVAGDTNGSLDVFVHDRQTGQTTRISIASDASDGTQGNIGSYTPSISGDGRVVAFYSDASNLVAGDTNGFFDVFVHDRQTGQTTRASVASDGAQGNSASRFPSISADAHFVAFYSNATNLVPGDTNGYADVFVYDRSAVLSITTSGSGAGTVVLSPPGGVYAEGTTVTLAAIGSVGSIFDHWEGDLTDSANPADIVMDANKNVVAYFFRPALTVESIPFGGVTITGGKPGTTDYTAVCDYAETVNLTAPESLTANGRTWYFQYWLVDGAPRIPTPLVSDVLDPNVQVLMDADRTLMAVYDWRINGDSNGDCKVNILDMLNVRNKLGTKCSP